MKKINNTNRSVKAICHTFALVVSGLGVAHAVVPSTITQSVSDGANSYTLNLTKESLRGPNFNIVVQDSSGSYNSYTPDEVRTYIGYVSERSDAIVVAYLQSDDTLWAKIYLDRGESWSALGSTITSKAVPNPSYSYPTTSTVQANQAGSTVYTYEMGFDYDYDAYNTTYGADMAELSEHLEKNFCELKAVQLRDYTISPKIGKVIVRSAQNKDPYDGLSGTAMLSPFASEWGTNQTAAMAYCLKAMLVTPNIGGGVAYVGGSYNVSQVKSTGWFMGAGRHELGHNFGALDYEAGSPEGPTIMCGNGISRFCGPSVRDALNHRNSKIGTKLYSIGGSYSTVDVPPYAALDTVSATVVSNSSVTVDVLANDFDANADTLDINSFDSSSARGGSIALSSGTGAGGRDELTYTAPANFEGLDHFFYEIEDSAGQTATGVVMVNVGVAPIWTLTTDADTYVEGNTSGNKGSNSTIVVKRSTAGASSSYTRTAWVHFDLTGKNMAGRTSTLSLTVEGCDQSSGTVTVWGIIDGQPGDELGTDWTESTITGANEPQSPDFAEDTNTTMLGTITWSGGAPASGKVLQLTSTAITDFLKSDTNGQVTILLTRNANDGNMSFRSKEHASGGAPTLGQLPYTDADAYVRGGSYANTNYGYDTIMGVKNDSSATYARETYVRFDYTGVSDGTVSSATLTLVPTSVQTGRTIRIRLVDDADEDWTESGITWNTKPASSGTAVTFSSNSLSVGVPYEIDVTSLLNQAMNTNKTATFHIDTTTVSATGWNAFGTMDHTNPAYYPSLEVTVDEGEVSE